MTLISYCDCYGCQKIYRKGFNIKGYPSYFDPIRYKYIKLQTFDNVINNRVCILASNLHIVFNAINVIILILKVVNGWRENFHVK